MKKLTLVAVTAAVLGLAACASQGTTNVPTLAEMQQKSVDARTKIQEAKDSYAAAVKANEAAQASSTASASAKSAAKQAVEDAKAKLRQAEADAKASIQSEKDAWKTTLGK